MSARWADTDDADRKYRAARDEAQRRANETGYDHGIEVNNLFREFHVFMLPKKGNRYGHELRCEVVWCADYDKIQPGHGP